MVTITRSSFNPFHKGHRLFNAHGHYQGHVIRVEYDVAADYYRATTSTGWWLTTTELRHNQGSIGAAWFTRSGVRPKETPHTVANRPETEAEAYERMLAEGGCCST